MVKTDENMMTSRRGIFAGGDCESGPALVIKLSPREGKQLSPLTVILVAKEISPNISCLPRKRWPGWMKRLREKD
jgi:hypothetical protein